MLQTQINYWSYLETVRHDIETEKEATRSNKAKEKELNRHQVVVEVETERHNRAMEDYNFGSLAETIRSNKERERLTEQEIANNYRLGLESNRIAMYNAQTRATEVRYNYEIGLKQTSIAKQNADTNRMNAWTQKQSVANQAWYQQEQARNQREANVIARSNADTNRMNALTNQRAQAAEQAYKEGSLNVSRYTAEQNASIGWQNIYIGQQDQQRKNRQLLLDSNKFNWQKWVDQENVATNYLNATANILRALNGGISNVNSFAAMPK